MRVFAVVGLILLLAGSAEAQTATPTNTPTNTPANTFTNTPTLTPTLSPTVTPTFTPTVTATFIPTNWCWQGELSCAQGGQAQPMAPVTAIPNSACVVELFSGHCLAATPTNTPTVTSTPAPTPPCCGDCTGVSVVDLADLILCGQIANGDLQLTSCPACDCDGNGTVTVSDLMLAQQNALRGCSNLPTPTPVFTGTPTRTPTPIVSPIAGQCLGPCACTAHGEISNNLQLCLPLTTETGWGAGLNCDFTAIDSLFPNCALSISHGGTGLNYPPSPGDLIIGNTSNTYSLLHQGMPGQVLTVDPAQPNGIGWDYPAGISQSGCPSISLCTEDMQRGQLAIDVAGNNLCVCNGAARGWDTIPLVP